MNTELKTRRNYIYALFATNKAKHILNRHFRAPVHSDTIHSESIKENREKVPFLKVYHFSISQHFPNGKVFRASSDRMIYAVVKTQNVLSSRGGFLTYPMDHYGESIISINIL